MDKKLMIEIDGNCYEVTKTNNYGYNQIELEDGTEWAIFETRESAGESAREYWEDMAQNDAKEFVCMVGEETLVQWGMGHFAGPGSTQVQNLEEWLDLWIDTPEEHFASYDGEEHDCRINNNLKEELGFSDKKNVCYRQN